MSKTSSRRRSAPRGNSRTLTRNPWLFLILIAVALLAVYLVVTLIGRPAAALPATISSDWAYQKYTGGAFLLDVRTQQEWDDFHVPGTTLVPLDQLPQRLAELPRDREIVVVCRSGNRSQQGRDILLNAGFTQVTSKSGGLNEWRSRGYPIEPAQ